MRKILVSSLLVVGLAVGSSVVVFAQNGGGTTSTTPSAGYNNIMGNGNGPGGSNSVYGGGYGNQWNGWQRPEQV